jgi:hypothetical protein
MKKTGVFAFIGLWLTSFVSAGPIEGVRQLLEGSREVAYLVIQFIFDISNDLGIYDQHIFAKLLLILIIYFAVYTVIKRNRLFGSDSDKNPINIVISVAIAILSVRFLPDEFIEAILLPYSALGVGLTVFLPLVIYFFFIHQSGIGYFGRKIGWLVFGTSFIALWWTRYDLLESANFIYWIGVIFIAVSFIFDKRIHKYFGLQSTRKFLKMAKDKQHRHWKRELLELENDYRNGIIDINQYNRERPIIEQHIRDTSP